METVKNEYHKQGSVIWIAPLIHWTTFEMNWFTHSIKADRNPVSISLGMSGECG